MDPSSLNKQYKRKRVKGRRSKSWQEGKRRLSLVQLTLTAQMSDAASPPPADVPADSPSANEPELPGPGAFLKGVVGQQVVVRLNSGVDYRGTLSCLDGYMNIALESTEEYVNGVKTNEYGDAFVRGNNVLYISRLS